MVVRQRLEERIGEVIREVRFPIEAGKIVEFARAMKDDGKVYADAVAARSAGYAAIPAPLTFSVASAHYAGGDATELPRRLGLDLSRTVHGEQRWVYHHPVVAGTVLHGVTRIAQVDRKQGRGGEMLRVLTETQYRDEEGKLVVEEYMLTIELPADK
jgi:hypothetical protein